MVRNTLALVLIVSLFVWIPFVQTTLPHDDTDGNKGGNSFDDSDYLIKLKGDSDWHGHKVILLK